MSFDFKSIFKQVDESVFNKHWTCNLCGNEIFDGGDFCEQCEKELHKNDGAICEVCGRSLPNVSPRCASCNNGWSVDFARSVYVYQDGITKLIHELKFGSKRFIAELFVDDLAKLYIKNAMTCDVIVSVPMTESRKKERGFNQSEYLARLVAERVNREYKDVLSKRKETFHQAELGYSDRLKNLHSAYVVEDDLVVKNKRVLIVDDVLTTGATSGELARMLKGAGASFVGLLTVASTKLRF